ncbi:subtilisin-like protein [Lactarius sanguifluus]|nr:subtilisin-like protein [Lactarius sanguifluus]
MGTKINLRKIYISSLLGWPVQEQAGRGNGGGGIVDGLSTPVTPCWNGTTVKHSWNTVPESWENLGHPPADTTIDLYLELKPQHENALADALRDVSDPGRAKYGAHLSMEQVTKLFAPHPDTPNLVNSWLEDHANVILGASYQLYQRVEVNDAVLRTLSYSLPDALHGHIQTVVPTMFFGSPRTQWKIPRIHPCGVAAARTKAGSEELNVIVTAIYAMEYPSPQDLRAFMTEYLTDGEDATFTVTQVNGGEYNPNRPGFEANLGLQYAEALTYPTRNIFYSTGGRLNTATDPYLNWLAYQLNLETIPPTISTTYGGPEYTWLGRVGVISGGDWGVGQGDCLVQSNNGQVGVQFLSEFPASCPWVTSVGGTTNDGPEIAAILSGGGFSSYFPRPYYQDIAVPLFLQDVGDIYGGLFNPYGRCIPDIAAQALDFEIAIDGEFEEVDGTSVSAPTMVGIISLLNDYRLSKGKPTFGFLNPWLYSFGLPPQRHHTCRKYGFPAIAGWGPVTGLGTPDFDKLENIIDEEKEDEE